MTRLTDAADKLIELLDPYKGIPSAIRFALIDLVSANEQAKSGETKEGRGFPRSKVVAAMQDWSDQKYGAPFSVSACHDLLSVIEGAGFKSNETAPALLENLRELYALVRGECPRLFNEDSGGDAELEMNIIDAIAKATA